jgi:tetratricopeptide (TPR) repeat protein
VHWLVLTSFAVLPGSARPINALSEVGGIVLGASAIPDSLGEARKLGDQLRYEEAVVEYQKYLTQLDRPLQERAAALFELGFVHLVLGDDSNAEQRAGEAFEQDPRFALPKGVANRQQAFYQKARKAFLSKPRLEILAAQVGDEVGKVRTSVVDPEGKVIRVLLRHALAANGPFYSTEMTCEGDVCWATIPTPRDVTSYTAFYYVEALDAAQVTRARVSNAQAPLQLAVVATKPWFQSPVVWGVAGATVMAVAAGIFLLSPQPAR